MRGKLALGRTFINGYGDRVEIIATDLKDGFIRDLYPILGLVHCKPFPVYDRYTPQGKWDICTHPKSWRCWYDQNLKGPAPKEKRQ